ncbi:MAG: hypothetical protein SFV21_12785 [Rhodospirillaceae bacterium]|nr:hypothetical protein [Rhodospirillaceae bacterium]
MIIAVALAGSGPPALAQPADKAEIVITNLSGRTVSVRYDFVFRDFAWNLIAFEVTPDGETIYRRPAGIVGCAQLNSWGIDQGRLTVADGGTARCVEPVSICDPTRVLIQVRADGCRTQRSQ